MRPAESAHPSLAIAAQDSRHAVHVDINRKPLCRFYFNAPQKRLGLFDGTRASSGALIVTQHDIASVDGIHAYADQIRETARRYLES